MDSAGIDPETLADSDFRGDDGPFILLPPLRADFADFTREEFVVDLDASGDARTNRFRTVLGPEFYPALLEMNRRLASPAQRTVVLRLKAE